MDPAAQKLKETIMKGNNYLHIKRAPTTTVTEIIDYFNEHKDEFDSNWGTGLKYIWDVFKGTLPLQNDQLRLEFNNLQEQIDELKNELAKLTEVPVTNTGKKLANGNVIIK